MAIQFFKFFMVKTLVTYSFFSISFYVFIFHIFVCAESSLLHLLFPSSEQGLPSSCGAQASFIGGTALGQVGVSKVPAGSGIPALGSRAQALLL